VTTETASKILFIGKSVKILKGSGKISSLPTNEILKEINIMFTG